MRFWKAPARVVAPILAICTVLVLSAADWPTYLGDGSRSGAGTDITLSTVNASQLTKLWNFPTGAPIAASASVVGGVVYVGSWDGYEYAIDAVTGVQKWKTFLGITSSTQCKAPPTAGISSAAAIVNGVVYVGGGDRFWHALRASDGVELWKVDTGDNSTAGGHYNWASPLIYNGFAYIGIASFGDCPLVQGQLMQVDLTTHAVVHTFNFAPAGHVGGGIWTSPAVDAATNKIYVTTGTVSGTGAGHQYEEAVVALDATNVCKTSCFTPLDSWQLPVAERVNDSDWGTSPIIFDDQNGRHLVAATNKNGFVYAWDRTNLAHGGTNGWVWKKQIATGGVCPTCGDGSVSSGAFDSNTHTLFMAGGHTTINGVNFNGSVRALDPATRNFKWEHGSAKPVIAALAYDNGLVMDGAGNILEVLNSSNGTPLYSYKTGATIYGAPSVANGEIFAGSVDKNVYAFGLGGTPPPPPTCPSGWNCADIGNPTPAGSQSTSGATWTINAGGADIWGTADQFRYVWQSMTSNSSVSAHIVSQTPAPPGNAWAKAGVMMRTDQTAGSPFYGVFVTPGNGVTVQYRTAAGVAAVMPVSVAGTTPTYLQVADTANVLTAYTSTNGTSWTPIANSSVTLALGTSLLGGVAVTSHDAATLSTVTVDTVTVGSTAPPPPGCPSGWSCGDIGSVGAVGTQSLDGAGNWSISGSGGDIWITADQFRYVYKFGPNTSPETVTANVTSQTNTNAWAKAGVMLRATTDPGSPEYAALVTPGNGIVVQYRAAQGGTTLRISKVLQGLPQYVRVNRTGDTFTAFTSPDGVTWTLIPGSSVTFVVNATMLEGLAVTSHNWSVLSTVTMDHVSLL